MDTKPYISPMHGTNVSARLAYMDCFQIVSIFTIHRLKSGSSSKNSGKNLDYHEMLLNSIHSNLIPVIDSLIWSSPFKIQKCILL